MLLGNQRLRELRYEDRAPSEPSAEESASALRDVPQGPGAKNKREPTLLGVGALERRAREATLVGVGLATPTPMPRSTDETIPRLEQTCDVSLGEMEVLAAQRGAADSIEHLSGDDNELKEDTQGEWIRFEKSFANATIATILCAILAFFLLPSGHDAPVPPPAGKNAKQAIAAASPKPTAPATHANETSIAAATPDAPSTRAPTVLDERTGAAPGEALPPDGAPSAEHALRIETAQDLAPAHDAVTPASADEKPKRRARTVEERKELRVKRRAARAKREALAKQGDADKRESREKRRKTTTEIVSKRVRTGGKS